MKNNFVSDSFPPQKIQAQVLEKGFYVYKYISQTELFASIKKDFLAILEKARWVLLAVIVVSYLWTESFKIVAFSLAIFYVLISIYLLAKLFWRTTYFLYLNNIIFTPQSLITGKSVFKYSDKGLQKELLSYEKIFDEYLTKESFLAQKVKERWKKLTQSNKKMLQMISKKTESFRSNKNDGKFQVLATVAIIIYIASIFIFYYLGIAIISLIFYIFSSILSIYLFFKDRPELNVKKQSEKIDASLQKMSIIWTTVSAELELFQSGEIFDLESLVSKKLTKFYAEIQTVFTVQKKLNTYIQNNFNKKLIDFATFESYVLKKMKEPMIGMHNLLSEYLVKIKAEQVELKTTKSQTSDTKMLVRLNQKQLHLQLMEKDIVLQREKMEQLKNQAGILK